MDKIKKYQDAIKTVIKKHSGSITPNYTEYNEMVVFDDERGHYLLMDIGWNKSKRIQNITIHIDIKEGKVWIQTDWTDTVITEQLEALGVDKQDIVLAFHAPCRRADMAYPVA